MKVIQETLDLLDRIAVDVKREYEYALWARGVAPRRMRVCPEGIYRREKPPPRLCGTCRHRGHNARIAQIVRIT
jgi:hypothetical protein